MTGTRRTGLVLQDRDRRLLDELVIMRVIDREQAKLVAGFGSTTRANTRLLALTRAGILRRFFTGTIVGGFKAIYSLSAKGAAIAGVALDQRFPRLDSAVVGERFLEHRMRVNAVYLAVKFHPIPQARFRRWVSFRAPLSKSVPLIPDGYFEVMTATETLSMFLEVDLGTEPQKRWQRKLEAYLQLAISGDFERLLGQPKFRVLVLANSSRRLSRIRSTVARRTDKIFRFGTFDIVRPENFWTPVWLRPQGETRVSLL